MGNDVVGLASVGALARRRWRVLALLAVIGAIVGFGASFVLSPGYSASSKVLLRGQPDDAQLLTEAQIAMSLSVLDRVAAELPWGKSGIDLQSHVTASVLDGNVLQVTGLANTPDHARELTDHTAAAYVAASTQIGNDTRKAADDAAKQRRDSAQKRLNDIGDQLAQAQAPKASPEDAARVPQLSTAFTAAQSDLTEIDREAAERADGPSTSVIASVLEPALDGGAAPPTPLQLTGGGALAAALLGLYALVRSRRRGGLLRDPEQISASLGAPVVASVVVSAAAAAAGTGDGEAESGDAAVRARAFWLTRLLDDGQVDPAAEVVPHPAGEAIRYGRALTRLGATVDGPFHLLVLVPAGDGAARAAVAELVHAIGLLRGSVRLVADDAGRAETYRQLVGARRGIEVTGPAAWSDTSTATQLRVAAVDTARPAVPDGGPTSGVLVTLGAGTRTTAELVELAAACFDASAPVTGVIVVATGRPVVPSGPARKRPGKPARNTGSSSSDQAMVRS